MKVFTFCNSLSLFGDLKKKRTFLIGLRRYVSYISTMQFYLMDLIIFKKTFLQIFSSIFLLIKKLFSILLKKIPKKQLTSKPLHNFFKVIIHKFVLKQIDINKVITIIHTTKKKLSHSNSHFFNLRLSSYHNLRALKVQHHSDI